MQCRDVRQIVDSYLSEELLIETTHEMILRHLETCRECRADLAARRALRASMRRAFTDAHDLDPNLEFVAQLRSRLRASTLAAPPRRLTMVTRWWALAAVVLLAIALGGVLRGYGSVTTMDVMARAAVGDHRNCALHFRLTEQPITLEEAAKRYDATYRVLHEFPPSDLVTAAGPAHVVDRHSCVYWGRRYAHIVLEYRRATVSLLVTAVDGSSSAAIPSEALGHLTSEGRIDDVSVVGFRTGRHMVFLAGDLEQADLLRLADAVAGPLYRQLAGT